MIIHGLFMLTYHCVKNKFKNIYVAVSFLPSIEEGRTIAMYD